MERRTKANRPPSGAFLESRAVRLISIADRADDFGKPNFRNVAEDILTKVIKESLRGRFSQEVLDRIARVQITPAMQRVEDE